MEPTQPAEPATDLKKLEDLTADPTNPRILSKHDGEALGHSIVKFGDLSCIVFNVRTQQLVGGHQRIEIMKRLGERHQIQITQRYDQPDEVGTVALGHVYIGNKAFAYREVDWDEGTQKAANIAANRIQGEFDNDLLAQVTYQLSQLDNGSELLALTGQTEDEISKLLDSVGAAGDNPADDEAPEVDEVNPAVSQLGEIYQLGSHRLMCGDSTDFGQVSDLMDGAEADMVFTDPPYGIEHSGKGIEGATTGNNFGTILGDEDVQIAKDAYNLISSTYPKASLIFWGANYYASGLPDGYGWIVWDKQREGDTFSGAEIAFANRGNRVDVFRHQWHGMIKASEHGEPRVHPTQKPVALAAWCFKNYGSERGGNVLDVFGGSGSTLIACDKLERICYMMELSEAYCDVIRKRYQKHKTGSEDGWVEATAPIVSSIQEPEPTPAETPPPLPEPVL